MSVEALVEVRRRTADICDLQIVSLVELAGRRATRAPSRARCCATRSQRGRRRRRRLPAPRRRLGRGQRQPARRSPPSTDATSTCTPTRRLDPACWRWPTSPSGSSPPGSRTGSPPAIASASRCSPRNASTRSPSSSPPPASASSPSPRRTCSCRAASTRRAMPRALTAVKALRAAGVNVCAGADNLQDPFNPMGRGDPLETAALMVMAAHLLPDQALHTVSARRPRGASAGAPATSPPASGRPRGDRRRHRPRGAWRSGRRGRIGACRPTRRRSSDSGPGSVSRPRP